MDADQPTYQQARILHQCCLLLPSSAAEVTVVGADLAAAPAGPLRYRSFAHTFCTFPRNDFFSLRNCHRASGTYHCLALSCYLLLSSQWPCRGCPGPLWKRRGVPRGYRSCISHTAWISCSSDP